MLKLIKEKTGQSITNAFVTLFDADVNNIKVKVQSECKANTRCTK